MSSLPRRGGAATAAPPVVSRIVRLRQLSFCLTAAFFMLSGCTYVDRARRGSDLVVGVAEHYKLETLVQADIERRRLRAARCYSPLLTPATLSAAASDGRLGPDWVDGLLRDCPQFGAFLSELMMRRARAAGLVAAFAMPAPRSGAEVQPLDMHQTLQSSVVSSGGVDDGGAPFEVVGP